MTETQISLARRALKSPRSAAIAGIVFAVLYGTSLALIRLSIPADITSDITWLETNKGTISAALFLVPYAGIAFLWFIGVIRDLFGELEDRLFATVFLGSGLLFLATTFVGAALAGGLISGFEATPGTIVDSGVFTYGREVMYRVINVYSFRMAGVFMISLGTIWYRTGLMHRGWAFLTYALALVLLLSIGYSLWVTLIFPGWVFAVSVYILVRNLRHQSQVPIRDMQG
jgi:hypothetical protein